MQTKVKVSILAVLVPNQSYEWEMFSTGSKPAARTIFKLVSFSLNRR